MRRYPVILAATLLMLIAAGCKQPSDGGTTPPRVPAQAQGYPSSMAALGDSITLAVSSCLAPTACPRNSWATGTGTQVNSHYERILRANPAIQDNSHNFAASGATVSDLPRQASAAAQAKVEYVTILIGANDACRARIEDMTDPATFRAKIDATLATLASRLPKTRILVLSVPDLNRLWQVGHTNNAVLKVWAAAKPCPALLANPTSNAAADTERRRAVSERVDAYNKQLAAACGAHRSQCRYDRGAVHRTGFGVKLLSPLDFFHPNASGQRLLARVTYPGRFSW